MIRILYTYERDSNDNDTTNGYGLLSAEYRLIVICTDAKNGRNRRVSRTI